MAGVGHHLQRGIRVVLQPGGLAGLGAQRRVVFARDHQLCLYCGRRAGRQEDAPPVHRAHAVELLVPGEAAGWPALRDRVYNPGVRRLVRGRIAAFRRGEQAVNTETVVEKELAVAKLSLLHAQVEPHFLYNSLANAQVLHLNAGHKTVRAQGARHRAATWAVGYEIPLTEQLQLTSEVYGEQRSRPDKAVGLRYAITDGLKASAAVGRGNGRTFSQVGMAWEF